MARISFAFIFFWVFTVGPLTPPLEAKARRPEPTKRLSDYSLTEGEEVKLRARKTKLPAYVFGDESGKKDLYSPSGFMGDSRAIQILTMSSDASAPASTGRLGRTSLRVRYQSKGQYGWAGIYWMSVANNWGRMKGAGYDLSKATRLTFWIRGKKGGEKISVVKVGGIPGAYPDSDVVAFGPLRVTQEWEQYTIPLEGKNLSHIIGGFSLIFRRADNPKGATIYLDEIQFRGPDDDVDKDLVTDVQKPIKVATKKVEPAPTPKPVDQLEKSVRRVVLFSSAKRGFSDQTKTVLKEILELTNKYKGAAVRLEGHTDNIGKASTNLRLSEARARAVADYLVENGLEETRLEVIGFGEEQPVADNRTKQGRLKNRRVEIEVAETSGL